MVLEFTADPATRDIQDQFMFGNALLVACRFTAMAPVHAKYISRKGLCGMISIQAKWCLTAAIRSRCRRMKRFLCLPARGYNSFRYAIQYTDQKQADEINLYVYAGSDGEFTLYEDENLNYNYEKGKYAMIPFSYDNAGGVLTIGDRKGEFPECCRPASLMS